MKFYSINENGEKELLKTSQIIVEFSAGLCVEIEESSEVKNAILVTALNTAESMSLASAQLLCRPQSANLLEIQLESKLI